MESFEQKVERAQQLLKRLGDPEIPLKEAVECYREGMRLLKEAEQLLEEAKQQLFEVVPGPEKVEVKRLELGEQELPI